MPTEKTYTIFLVFFHRDGRNRSRKRLCQGEKSFANKEKNLMAFVDPLEMTITFLYLQFIIFKGDFFE